MTISFEVILGIAAGFSFGCLLTTIIALVINSSQKKKLEKSAQTRQKIVNTIGTLCASVENAYSSYRVGSINYNDLRNALVEKIETINTELNSHIDILDSFYIKNIERFLVDQKCFLLHREGDKPESATGQTVRGVSRSVIQDVDAFIRAEDQSAFEHKAEMTAVPVKKPRPQPAPVAQQAPPVVQAAAVIEKEEAKTEDIQEKALKIEEEAKPVFAVKIDKEPALDTEIKPIKPPKTAKVVFPGPKERVLNKEQPAQEQQPIAAEKEAPVAQTEQVPESRVADVKVKTEEALKAFGLGATAAISLDAIKEMEKGEEEAYFDVESPSGALPPLPDNSFLDTPLPSKHDVEATQVYDIRDLMAKKSGKPGEPMPVRERQPEQQRVKGVESHIEMGIKEPLSLQKKEKKEGADESLVTGDDVMDFMDDFFGFGEEKK